MEQVETGAQLDTGSSATTAPQAWTPNSRIFLSNTAVLSNALRNDAPALRTSFLNSGSYLIASFIECQ